MGPLKTYEEVMLGSYRKPVGMVGGLTQFQAVKQSHKDVWDSVLTKLKPEYNNVNLRKLGDPVAVSTQVVAGANYLFKFDNGTVIKVFHQLWTDTLKITEVNNVEALETNTEIPNRLLLHYIKTENN